MNIFKVEIKGDKILVHAKATPYDPGRKPRVREGSRSAAKYLKKLGHTFEKCLNPKLVDKSSENVILNKEEKTEPKETSK